MATRVEQSVNDLFAAYLKKCQYLRNFSPRTITSCKEISKRWEQLAGGMPSKENLPAFVIAMHETGLAVTTCNITIQHFNSFLT